MARLAFASGGLPAVAAVAGEINVNKPKLIQMVDFR